MDQGNGERRRVARIALRIPLEVTLPDGGVPQARLVFGELRDVGADGGGATVIVSGQHRIPVGGPIALDLGDGATVRGVVVSRMGVKRRCRLGIRVDIEDRAQLTALTGDMEDRPNAGVER